MNHDEAVTALKNTRALLVFDGEIAQALDYAIAQLERKGDYEPTDYEKAAIKNALAKPADDGMV